jgi:hypothetical protein
MCLLILILWLIKPKFERYEKYLAWKFIRSVVLFLYISRAIFVYDSYVKEQAKEQAVRREQAAQREREQAALRALGVHGVFLKFFREQWPDELDPFIKKTAAGLYGRWQYCLQNRGPFLTFKSEVIVYAEYL